MRVVIEAWDCDWRWLAQHAPASPPKERLEVAVGVGKRLAFVPDSSRTMLVLLYEEGYWRHFPRLIGYLRYKRR
jgi:hypothetical protein